MSSKLMRRNYLGSHKFERYQKKLPFYNTLSVRNLPEKESIIIMGNGKIRAIPWRLRRCAQSQQKKEPSHEIAGQYIRKEPVLPEAFGRQVSLNGESIFPWNQCSWQSTTYHPTWNRHFNTASSTYFFGATLCGWVTMQATFLLSRHQIGVHKSWCW